MNKNYTILTIALVVGFLIGGWAGCHFKKCPEMASVETRIDTVFSSYPIVDTFMTSKPVNKYIYKTVHVQPTLQGKDTIWVNHPKWESFDTLRHEGLFVSISDIGDCSGVMDRKAVFSGSLKERIITNTITNNVLVPPPMISLHAGASASFSNRWKAFDVAPVVTLAWRQKHLASYSYGLNTSTHTVSLQIKIR